MTFQPTSQFFGATQITLKIHVSAYGNASATGATDGLWEAASNVDWHFYSYSKTVCVVDSAIGDAISV